MTKYKSLDDLSNLLDTYQHFSLCKGAEKLVPYNNKNRTPADQLEIIKARLNSPACPSGEYSIFCKNVLRNDVKPDEVIFQKEGTENENLKEAPAKLTDANKFEFECFKLQFLNDQLKKENAELKADNVRILEENLKLETELLEFEESEALEGVEPTTPAGPFGLSEATLKPLENILQILVPVFQPLMSSMKEGTDLKNKMKLAEFNFQLKQRYNSIGSKASPEVQQSTDDDFIRQLKELKENSPEQYAAFVEQVTTPPEPEQNDNKE